jgi:hypothetical protein
MEASGLFKTRPLNRRKGLEQCFSNCGPRTTSGPRVLLIHLINVSTNIYLFFI